MSQIGNDLLENNQVSNRRLLNYIISIQLAKIERYNNETKEIINEESEEAMANMIELLKIRQSISK